MRTPGLQLSYKVHLLFNEQLIKCIRSPKLDNSSKRAKCDYLSYSENFENQKGTNENLQILLQNQTEHGNEKAPSNLN